MALANLAALRTAQLYPTQEIPTNKGATGNAPGLGVWASFWTDPGLPGVGAIPGAGVVTTRATVGALAQVNKLGTEQRAWLRRYGLRTSIAASGYMMLVDRLAHMGGLDGTVTTSQTVSTPTLTRSTSGVGVIAAIEIYTAIGATNKTATMVYDSDSGTGHTSQPVNVVTPLASGISRALFPLGLQLGDLGVQKVTSVQLSGSTGTAGNFGITLYKPLWIWPFVTYGNFPHNGDPIKGQGAGGMPVIPDDACLQIIHNFSGGTGNGHAPLADLAFFED